MLKKLFVYTACTAITLAATGCATFVAGAPEGTVDVIAHRGASAYAPENTLAAFSLAHALEADWFELDCTLTKDNEVLVIHDDSTDRTTGIKGKVRDMTLAELKALDAGSWKDARFAGESLPTLDESLDFAKDKIGVYIEIKNSADDEALMGKILAAAEGVGVWNRALQGETMRLIEASNSRNLTLTRACIDRVRARNMEKQVVIQSFSPIICAVALIEAPDIRTEYLGAENKDHPERWENFLRWAELMDVPGCNINFGSYTPERLAMFHKDGRTVAVWTVDKPEEMRFLVDTGADAIITNRPDLCLETLARP